MHLSVTEVFNPAQKSAITETLIVLEADSNAEMFLNKADVKMSQTRDTCREPVQLHQKKKEENKHFIKLV